MLTVSIHGIQLHAYIGLYPEEKVTGNNFEVDVDVTVPSSGDKLPFVDYAIVHKIVTDTFLTPGDLIETYVELVHKIVKERFPIAAKVKVTVRKLQPPLGGDVRYAQVCFEG